MLYICNMKKDTQILLRLSDTEKEDFKRAAEISGLGLSSWARQVLRSSAIKELQSVGEKVNFLEPTKKENK